MDAEGDPITGGIALMPSQRSGSNTDIQMGARIDGKGGFEFRNAARVRASGRAGRSGGWNEGEFAYRFISVVDADITDIEPQTPARPALAGRIVSDGAEIPKSTRSS